MHRPCLVLYCSELPNWILDIMFLLHITFRTDSLSCGASYLVSGSGRVGSRKSDPRTTLRQTCRKVSNNVEVSVVMCDKFSGSELHCCFLSYI